MARLPLGALGAGIVPPAALPASRSEGGAPDALGPADLPLDLGAAPAPGKIDPGFDLGVFGLDLIAFDGIDAGIIVP
ncbi:MAG: hypothetical protein M3442_08695 [Chloroflexota bacterium]|nr:hypothetical protein [Chloroflexota bacterium]